MSGRFTRRMYDDCATDQDTKQSTGQLNMILDLTKFVNCNRSCNPDNKFVQNIQNPFDLVDVESSLMGIDRPASNCDIEKYPYCASKGCILTGDSRVPQHTNPYVCERGYDGDNTLVQSNMKMPQYEYKFPTDNVCQNYGSGYILNLNGNDNMDQSSYMPPNLPGAPLPNSRVTAPIGAGAPLPSAPQQSNDFSLSQLPIVQTLAPQIRNILSGYKDNDNQIVNNGQNIQLPPGFNPQNVQLPPNIQLPPGFNPQNVQLPPGFRLQASPTGSLPDLQLPPNFNLQTSPNLNAPPNLQLLNNDRQLGLDFLKIPSSSPNNTSSSNIQNVQLPPGFRLQASPTGSLPDLQLPPNFNLQTSPNLNAPPNLQLLNNDRQLGLDFLKIPSSSPNNTSSSNIQNVRLPPGTNLQNVQLPPGLNLQNVQLPPGFNPQNVQLPPGLNLPTGTKVQTLNIPPKANVQLPSGINYQDIKSQSGISLQNLASDAQSRWANNQQQLNGSALAAIRGGTYLPSGYDSKVAPGYTLQNLNNSQLRTDFDLQNVQLPSGFNGQLPPGFNLQNVQLPSGFSGQLPPGFNLQNVQLPPGFNLQNVQLPSGFSGQLPPGFNLQNVQLPSGFSGQLPSKEQIYQSIQSQNPNLIQRVQGFIEKVPDTLNNLKNQIMN